MSSGAKSYDSRAISSAKRKERCTRSLPEKALHVLLAGTSDLRAEQIRKNWRLGFTQVRLYDASRGATFYSVKEFGKTWDFYDFYNHLPRPP